MDDEHNFFAAIQSYYTHVEAAERDAASVAWVMRRRKGNGARDVLKAKFVLLTRNERLYRMANRFCRERRFTNEDAIGPTALVRDIAGILWIISGSEERATLSKRQLLLNCQKARANAPEIVSSMYATIKSVNPTSAELFWAAVQRPAYMSMALDAVAAGGATASHSTADEVLERIRSDLVAAERTKGREALKKLSDRYDQDANLREVVIATLERESDELREQNARHLVAWSKVALKERAIAGRAAARQALALTAIGVGALVLVAGGAGYIGSDAITLNPLFEAAVVVLAAILLLFISVTPIISWAVRTAERNQFRKYERAIRDQVPSEHVEAVLNANPLLPRRLQALLKLAIAPAAAAEWATAGGGG